MGTMDSTSSSSRSEASPFMAPKVSLPTGGGAIRGIDEKFTTNPATGTGSLSIPLALSPGRSGFGPKLSLDYDSGSGNGVFGFGWKLSMPSITRRTDKGLPRYHDCLPESLERSESDIFVLSGSEDLVAVLISRRSEQQSFDEFERGGYRVRRYRPRIDALFARIERWTCVETGETHWRSISKDNVLTVYGLDAQSRIADPENPRHVFSWLISRSYDDTGNAIIYDYVGEDSAGVDQARPSERHRIRDANRYPKRIRYGNRRPLLLDADRPSFRASHLEPHDPDGAEWMFEVVFDYGEAHRRDDPPDDERQVWSAASPRSDSPWLTRGDPFSSYRSGFEIRTYRLCRGTLMFHHFDEELGSESCLVRSTTFHYDEKPFGSFLSRVTQSGHKSQDDGRYLLRSLPPLDLFYTTTPLEDPHFQGYRLERVDPESLANLPAGVDDSQYRLLDLDGEGIAGVLTEQADAWLYKPNLGDGRFGAVQTVADRPSLAALEQRRQQFMDLTGDGVLDLVDFSPSSPGFYERKLDAAWSGFRAFDSLPVQDWGDPNLRFVDLTGDGVADMLIIQDDASTWHPSLLEDGFGRGYRIPTALDEERGPRVVFSDNTETIHLADMTGDGLADLVRVRNGETCYWPNLGYGRFGAKITMDSAPWFDDPDQFEPGRTRLADTDGSGTTDIIYLGRKGVAVYLNECGNGWSSARRVRPFPVVDDVASVTVADFLGRGTACLLWSSPLPADGGQQLRYLDLMCGRKPHLLDRTVNNLGAETRIDYASSTKFYLADKAAGAPWVTRLAFPVHVVERVETYDFISRNRFVTRYSYHHGFYDGVEREFRGFGRVDQLDTEAFAALSASRSFPVGENVSAASSVPPVLTRIWYHTGVYLSGGRISRHLAHEYYQEGSAHRGESGLSEAQIRAMLLDDTILPEDLTPEEAREACRSLKGSMLRQETYGLDETEQSNRPYSVTENNFTIRTLQRRGPNRHAVFFTHAREQVGFHYERKLFDIDGCRHADPRVSHGVTLEVDDYGNVLKSVAIGYGRRFPDPSPLLNDEDREKQAHILLTLTENDYTNVVDESDAWRTPLSSEQRLFELIKVPPKTDLAGITNFLRFRELADKVAQASDRVHDLPFEDWQGIGAVGDAPYRRLLKKSRSVYRSNHLRHLLPLGRSEALALPGRSYQLAFTSGLLTEVYRRGEPPEDLFPTRETVLREEGGYLDLDEDGNWWAPSGRIFYSAEEGDDAGAELAHALRHFFLPHQYCDAFGNVTKVAYDRHDLAPVETMDPVGNVIRAELDYRVLSPRLITDPNENRSEVAFDALGLVAGTAVMGKIGEHLGDSLEGFRSDLSQAQLDGFFADPRRSALDLLGNATTRIVYDVDRYFASGKPTFAATIARETHVSDLEPGERTKTQISLCYSDGFSREIQKKLQAEPGPLVNGGPRIDSRWIGSGWSIFNNKGNPVRQYEPFFSASHDFEFAAIVGVSPILFYDPVERVVATLHPNNIYEKVVFDPWRQTSWDVNDTVLFDPRTDPDVQDFFVRLPEREYLPTWYRERIDGALGSAEKAAAEKAAKHADTPTTACSDSLGRTFLSIADNGRDESGRERKYLTRTVLDVEGNRRAVIDALDRVVACYDYDALGGQIHQASMEAGERWSLADVNGKPIRAWNSRLYQIRTQYDALRRPVRSFVRGGDPYERNARTYSREVLFERTVYGDGADAELTEHRRLEANLRGKMYRRFDSAGLVTTDRYDFKGNLLRSQRRFARDYKNIPDWSEDASLEPESFGNWTSFDALNRVVITTSPDQSVYRPSYNEANLLDKIDVALRGAQRDGRPVWTPFVLNIEYNARGQRTCIDYANRAVATYAYDNKTFRLVRLNTRRPQDRERFAAQIFADAALVQDLHYVYDPAGNITDIADRSLRTVFHDNCRVDPVCNYTYDPLYRLIEATGRENKAQSGFRFEPPNDDYRDYPFVGANQLGDLLALRNFEERYEYDPVGNFLRLIHRAENGNWTRRYAYGEESTIEHGRMSNRLSRTHLEAKDNPVLEPYLYDAHGNIIQMPHLPAMLWDFMDRLAASVRQVVNTGAPETTFYVYDSGGQRARKVTETRSGARRNERLYVGGFEVFRKYESNGVVTERETLHVMADANRIALVETLSREGGQSLHAPESVQRYQLTNHLGSATLELDEAARLISYEEYAPYGETVYQAGEHCGEVRRKRYRYTGKERDEENGFTYHSARYYAPWLARWTAADPGGIVSAPNLYIYVSANPIVAVDGTGYDDDKVIDQSDEYGGALPPGGAPEPPPTAPPPNAGGGPGSPPETQTVYPADFIGPLPEGATRDTSPAPDAPPAAPPPAKDPPTPFTPPAAPDQANPESASDTNAEPQSPSGGEDSDGPQEGPSILEIAKDVRDGLLHGLAQSVPVVGWFVPNQLSDRPHNTKAYELGRAGGLIGGGALETYVIGPGLIGLGGGGAILGAATGPGEVVIGPAGVAVAAGGVVVTANGVYSIGKGVITIAHAMAAARGAGGGGGGGAGGRGGGGGNPLRGQEAADAARALGYDRRISPQRAPFDSHGQPVFSNGRNYITPDIGSGGGSGSHTGGVWKMFDRRGIRIGTYDGNLNRIGP
jgi:RHS repeat-associated protein